MGALRAEIDCQRFETNDRVRRQTPPTDGVKLDANEMAALGSSDRSGKPRPGFGWHFLVCGTPSHMKSAVHSEYMQEDAAAVNCE